MYVVSETTHNEATVEVCPKILRTLSTPSLSLHTDPFVCGQNLHGCLTLIFMLLLHNKINTTYNIEIHLVSASPSSVLRCIENARQRQGKISTEKNWQ